MGSLSPEEKYLREQLNKAITPLEGRIKELEKKVQNLSTLESLLGAHEQFHLHTRIKVFLENEYLNAIVEPDTCCTDEEFKRAQERAQFQTIFILEQVRTYIDETFKNSAKNAKPL